MQISFRPLSMADLPRLRTWVTRDHVARWYGEIDEPTFMAKFTPRTEPGAAVRSFIVDIDGRDVGYIQAYPLSAFPSYEACVGLGPGIVGVDLLLGEARDLHRGWGPQVIRRFVDDVVFVERDVRGCVAGPSPANAVSVRAFEKAGFRTSKVIMTPEGVSEQVMFLERGDALTAISAGTLAHYEASAAGFREGTRDHDVSQNIDALLRHIRAAPPFAILDFGCGPGRDLAAFRALGHAPIGLEGSPTLAAMAREHSGCEVWEQDFLALDLPASRFDGIFANASLFHVPRRELPRVLRELRACLKPGGVLFSSNPRGDNEEGWNRGRYGAYHDLETWRGFLAQAGFTELEHYYRPAGLPREQQPWLASVWRA